MLGLAPGAVYKDEAENDSEGDTCFPTSRFGEKNSEVIDSATASPPEMTIAFPCWTLMITHVQPLSRRVCHSQRLTKWQGLQILGLRRRAGSDARLAQPRNQKDLDRPDSTSNLEVIIHELMLCVPALNMESSCRS